MYIIHNTSLVHNNIQSTVLFSILKTDLVQSILSELDASDDLLVDEVCPNRVIGRVVPRSKDLLAEEEPPWSIPLTGSLLLGILLTLRNGIHHMITSTAQGRHLQKRVGSIFFPDNLDFYPRNHEVLHHILCKEWSCPSQRTYM